MTRIITTPDGTVIEQGRGWSRVINPEVVKTRREYGIPDYVPFPADAGEPVEDHASMEQRFGIGSQDGDGYDWQGFSYETGHVASTWRFAASQWRKGRAAR